MIRRRDFILSIGAFGFVSACSDGGAGKLVGVRIPDAVSELIDGNQINLGKLGRPAVIRFFGLWCPPCMADEENWNEAIRGLKQNNLAEIIEVHIDQITDKYASINDWSDGKPQDLQVPVIYDDDVTLAEAIGVIETPTILLVNNDGVVLKHISALDTKSGAANFVKEVAKLINQ